MSTFDKLLEQLKEEHHKAMSDMRKEIDEIHFHYQEKLKEKVVNTWKSKQGDSNSSVSKQTLVQQQTLIPEPSETMKAGAAKGKHRPAFHHHGRYTLDLDATRKELQKQMANIVSLDDSLKPLTLGKKVFYTMENLASIYTNFFFYGLWIIILVATIVLGLCWRAALGEDSETTIYFFLDMYQLIASQGIDSSVRGASQTVIFNIGLALGLVIFAIQVGIITETFQSLVTGINTGKSEVPEKGHTLLLGWNESTERVVCQLAFLRRQYIKNNSGFVQKYLRLGRVSASTPVAKASIVIMCNSKTKDEMHDAIKRAFVDRGISPERTQVGWDVICRVGDPTNTQDLIRVGAHNAKAIAVMLTNQDLLEEQESFTENGATFRTVLALRQVLFSGNHHPPWEELRVVVPLSRPDKAIHSAAFSHKMPDTDGGFLRKIMIVQDLSIFVNTLIFTCSTQNGLAEVLMQLMSFEDEALRLRKVVDFPDYENTLVGKNFRDLALAWDGCVFAGIVPAKLMEAEEIVLDDGLAPQGDRVIKEDDRLIFVSPTSLPKEAVDIPPAKNLETSENDHAGQKKQLSLLVCGFRDEWKTFSNFADQISEIGFQLGDGSKIHFLNIEKEDDFDSLMDHIVSASEEQLFVVASEEQKQKEGGRAWIFDGRVLLKHTFGDSSKYHALEKVVKVGNFDVAIVVPPPNCLLSGQAQDTRLMSIMCLLRAICDKDDGIKPIHVIGENKLESTATLALRPRGRDETTVVDETDFVNVQAIIARSLCQALAYPFMQPAVVQLLSSDESSPSIHICLASYFLPLYEEVTFADAIRQVKKGNPDDILIGYRVSSEKDGKTKTVFAPGLNERQEFDNDDQLVIISRKVPKPLLPTGSTNTSRSYPSQDCGESIGAALLPKEPQMIVKKVIRKKKTRTSLAPSGQSQTMDTE